jgi:isoleucyl-tRNA synthetase
MHGSWGNLISAEEAFDRMGADVMRWLYCQQPPTQNIRFGYGPADEVKRKLLTLWNSARFLTEYAAIEGFEPRYSDLGEGVTDIPLRPLDRWMQARTQQLIVETEAAYESYMTVDVIRALDSFVDDLSNWYIRRSRRRFYTLDEAAFRVLWSALVQALRVMAPIMPFLCEHLWQSLVFAPCEGAPESIHLAGWPRPVDELLDTAVLEEIAAVRRVVQVGRKARGEAGVKLRQPLRRVYVRGAGAAVNHTAEIAEELRVKEVGFDKGPVAQVQLLPNLPVLGPRLGKKIPEIRAALGSGDYEELPEGRLRVAGEELGPDEVIRGERVEIEGWAIADDDGVSVAFDTELDDELQLEGRVYDMIHTLNAMRRDQGLDLTDRIAVTLPEGDAALLEHADWIKREVLARRLEVDGGLEEPAIEKL